MLILPKCRRVVWNNTDTLINLIRQAVVYVIELLQIVDDVEV